MRILWQSLRITQSLRIGSTISGVSVSCRLLASIAHWSHQEAEPGGSMANRLFAKTYSWLAASHETFFSNIQQDKVHELQTLEIQNTSICLIAIQSTPRDDLSLLRRWSAAMLPGFRDLARNPIRQFDDRGIFVGRSLLRAARHATDVPE